MKRYGKDHSQVVRAAATTFYAPKQWAAKWRLMDGDRPSVFVCPWSDFFIAEADEWRNEAWGLMALCSELTFIIPTKRPERIAASLPEDWGKGYLNVWLLVSCENQEALDMRWPILSDIPASIRGISAEPLLGPLDMDAYLFCDQCREGPWAPGAIDAPLANANGGRPWRECCCSQVDIVIAGCESGPNRRHMAIEWVQRLAHDCRCAKTPFFLKQMEVNGKLVKMPALDGKVWAQLPIRRPRSDS
jgi:protein gp37